MKTDAVYCGIEPDCTKRLTTTKSGAHILPQPRVSILILQVQIRPRIPVCKNALVMPVLYPSKCVDNKCKLQRDQGCMRLRKSVAVREERGASTKPTSSG